MLFTFLQQVMHTILTDMQPVHVINGHLHGKHVIILGTQFIPHHKHALDVVVSPILVSSTGSPFECSLG